MKTTAVSAISFMCVVACAATEKHAAPSFARSAPETPVARWLGPEHIPWTLAADERGRDVAAVTAVLGFWARSRGATGVLSSFSAAAPHHGPMLAGDVELLAREAGLTSMAFHGVLEDVTYELASGRPVIVGIAGGTASTGGSHLEVAIAFQPDGRRIRSFDPARGLVERTYGDFEDGWRSTERLTLVLYDAAPPPPLSRSAGHSRRGSSLLSERGP